MMTRNKVFIGILILALLAGVFAYFIAPKLNKQATSYAECVQYSGVILESYPSRCVYKGVSFTNPDQASPVPPSTTKAYEDKTYKFSFQYPTDIFKQTSEEVVLPFTNAQTKKQGVMLKHTLNVKHCDLSGEATGCEPTTTDISIAVVPLDVTMEELMQSKFAEQLEDMSIGQLQAKRARQAAEGEGIDYYFIALAGNKSLMISRSFIDERAVTNYQSEEGFIPFAKQEEITQSVLKSLKVELGNNTATNTGASLADKVEVGVDWETFTNNTRGYRLRHPKNWIVTPVNLDSDQSSTQPLRFLRFDSPNKNYKLTIGIKNNTEEVRLTDRTDNPLGKIETRGMLKVAGADFPIQAVIGDNGQIKHLFYYNELDSFTNVEVKNYLIQAEFIYGGSKENSDLPSSQELKIANAILSSLVLTK